MKVQDVKKECLATVGLSIEFSNSEVSSLGHLLHDVTRVIDEAIERAKGVTEETRMPYDENDKIRAIIDLKLLKRVEWILTQLTRRDISGLFALADADYRADLAYINNIPAQKENSPAI